jgi:hypothetical protein
MPKPHRTLLMLVLQIPLLFSAALLHILIAI